MRKNVKVLSLILAGAMAMSLAGCSGSGSKDSAKETAAKSEAKEAGAESSGQETSKAAGAEEADASGETYQIGVLQLVQHDALDAANKGFFAALDEAGINYEADQQNASGEQANCMTIAEKLVNDGSDHIIRRRIDHVHLAHHGLHHALDFVGAGNCFLPSSTGNPLFLRREAAPSADRSAPLPASDPRFPIR